MLKLKTAVQMLHKPDTYLMQMNTPDPEFFIVPGGRVSAADAAIIQRRPDMAPRDNGLFPGIKQSWAMVRS
jgi:hypothetical protein